MKHHTLTLLLAATLTGHAAVIDFHLSPSGTDAAVGLSPLNVVPPASGSSAGGAEMSGLVFFDTEASTLTFAFTYGSFGWQGNLSSPLMGVGIHGPAPVGQNAGRLFDLNPYNVPMGFPPVTGVVFGTVIYPPSRVPDLLHGLNYINISSVIFPNGELRAQLIPAVQPNSAPMIECPDEAAFECGESVVVSALVSDPDGDPLEVVWEWNGWAIETNMVPAGTTPALPAEVTFTGELPPGDGTLSARVTDPDGAEAVCDTMVSIVDSAPPVILSAAPDRTVLWPPNHKMVPVSIDAIASDACGTAVWGIVSVTSNESNNGKGDGNTSEDWQIQDDHTVLLRAERSGRGNGRIYYIGIQAMDEADNLSAWHYIQVEVPH